MPRVILTPMAAILPWSVQTPVLPDSQVAVMPIPVSVAMTTCSSARTYFTGPPQSRIFTIG